MVLAVAEAAVIVAVGVQAADRVKGSPARLRQGPVWGCTLGRREHTHEPAMVRPQLGALGEGLSESQRKQGTRGGLRGRLC